MFCILFVIIFNFGSGLAIFQVLLLGSLANDSEKDEEQSADSFTTVYVRLHFGNMFWRCIQDCLLMSFLLIFVSDHFWAIAIYLVCGTECSFRLAYLPHIAKQDYN